MATPVPRVLGHQVVGTVVDCSENVNLELLVQRIGVGWNALACDVCRWCQGGEENLCPEFRATGRDRDGSYAEFMTIPAAITVPIPDALDAAHAAPMLCAGAIGYRSLHLADINNGQILALNGFGASNHLVLDLVRALMPDSPVYVFACDEAQRAQALERGADWAGDTYDLPPQVPDAIIDTKPVWETVMAALSRLAPGGRLVINAIAKEPGDRNRLTQLDYASQLWKEKEVKPVANVTRDDIRRFLDVAAEHGIRPEITVLPMESANEAVKQIQFGEFRGAFGLLPDQVGLGVPSN